MASSSPLGDYLRSRRDSLRPEDVGLVTMGYRRVEGLRRDEVAQLSGVSEDYYLRLEQGRDRQPSDQVLASLARALRLDYGALQYMKRLVAIQSGAPRLREPRHISEAIDAALGDLLDQWSSTPAYITDRNQTVVMVNSLAEAILPGMKKGASLPLLVFSPEWRAVDLDWEASACATLSALRFNSDPTDQALRELVGVMTMRDDDFARIWARHDASPPFTSSLQLSLSGYGTMDFTKQALLVPGARGHVITVLTAEADSPASDVLRSIRAVLPKEINVDDPSNLRQAASA